MNVAIATRRPLLVRGDPGTGKSSLAGNVADVLGWRYYEMVITSRTQARDLLWDVDLVRRLHDAQTSDAGLPEDYARYLVPGVLWWAFDPASAQWRGTDRSEQRVEPIADPQRARSGKRAVTLLDEIDKADPDVPNNLLAPLGSLQFTVQETGFPVVAEESMAPLVVLTTNDERELPPAFLRRCVELKLEMPRRSRLMEIARAHFPKIDEGELRSVADALLPGAGGGDEDPRTPISPAEFIDTVRAKRDLRIDVDGDTWKALTAITAWKHGKSPAA